MMTIVDGNYTGLQLPLTRPKSFDRYADSVEPKSQQEIIDVIQSPTFRSGRMRWDNDRRKNQGQRGACNGFAGAIALETSREILGHDFVALSGEGLYAQINGGRDQGSMLDDGMKAIVETGVPPQDMVPHEEYRWNRVSDEAKAACSRFRAGECYQVDTELELADGLASGFTGVVAVHATNAWSRLDSAGVCGTSNGVGNHAVCVDGIRWQNNELQFDMPNSWGLAFGMQGRGWLTWARHFKTSVEYHAFYLIRSAMDDPQGDNPPAIDGEQPQPTPVATVSVLMGSRSDCSWCNKWKAEELPELQLLGWEFEDVHEFGSAPTFAITANGKSSKLVGFTTVEKMQQIIEKTGTWKDG